MVLVNDGVGRMKGNGLVAAKTALERAKVAMKVVKRIMIDLG
jgi:hypothetical protein